MKNSIKVILVLNVFCFVAGCEPQESRPSYGPIKNTLKEGGLTIKWDESGGLVNVPEIEKKLTDNEKEIFNQSLEWLATESDVNFSYLSGKSAKQVVEMSNCLKLTKPESSDKCLN